MLRSLLLLALAAAPALAAEGTFGLSAARHAAWINALKKKGLRPVLVSAHSQAGKPAFSALAVANPDRFAWSAQSGLTAAAFNARFKQLSRDGYRLESLSVYAATAGARFADVWVKDRSVAWASRFGLSHEQYQEFFNEQNKKGFRPVCVNGYLERGAVKYAAVFHQRGGEWVAHHGLQEDDYGRKLNDYKARGFRAAFVSAFHDGKRVLVNLVVEKAAGAWALSHGMSSPKFQDEMKAQSKAGLELAGLAGYTNGRDSRYAAFWHTARRPAAENLPVTGVEVPSLAAFDKAMLAYMKEREIEAGVLCVSREGKIVLSRGYGFLTRDHAKKLPPDAPFRIASVTKPITAALIRGLARRGKLKLSDKAFAVLGVDLPPGKKADPRLKDITIEQLLAHKGGFDRDAAPLTDPMFQAMLVRRELKLSGPPTPLDVVRFMNGRKLDFPPGSKTVYSNYGYCVLGRVIEKVTGASYEANVRGLLRPLGVTSVELGRTLPEKRSPKEPFYSDPGFSTNVISGTGTVPWPDGGFCLEVMDSHGGLIATAPGLSRFLHAYWISGEPRMGNGQTWTFFGSLPGTFAMVKQRPDGVNIVALFNQRTAPAGKKAEDIEAILDRAAGSITKWP